MSVKIYDRPVVLGACVESDVADAIRAEAAAHGTSVSAIVAHLLTTYARRPTATQVKRPVKPLDKRGGPVTA